MEQEFKFTEYSGEVDEISFEDLEAASDKFDDIKANPTKYFEKKQDNSKIIASLRKSAESCINKAEKVNTEVSGNWTYRRQKFADSAQRKKDTLLKNANALNRLASLWEENNCPEILKGIRSASDFDIYYPMEPDDDHPIGGWYREEYPKKLKRALKVGLKASSDNELFKNAIIELSQLVFTPEQQKERELKEALKKVHSYNIKGFFPTPDDVIDKMIELADLQDGQTLLEPSAGIGSILDRIKDRGFNCITSAVEQQYSLVEILNLKGYSVTSMDIMEYEPHNKFDRILMNPPFENGQDMEHVKHCFDYFLKPEGILVSVMSASVASNTASKYVAFREFALKHGEFYHVDPGAFKNAFNSTGVSVIICVLTK